jgi:hypothetical protein
MAAPSPTHPVRATSAASTSPRESSPTTRAALRQDRLDGHGLPASSMVVGILWIRSGWVPVERHHLGAGPQGASVGVPADQVGRFTAVKSVNMPSHHAWWSPALVRCRNRLAIGADRVVPVHGHAGRVRGGDDRHRLGQHQVADHPFLAHPQQRVHHRRGAGGELGQKQQRLVRFDAADRPVDGGVADHAVDIDGQPRDVGGVPDGPDNGFDVPVPGDAELIDGGALAHAGLAPGQDGHLGPDGGGEEVSRSIGSRYGAAPRADACPESAGNVGYAHFIRLPGPGGCALVIPGWTSCVDRHVDFPWLDSPWRSRTIQIWQPRLSQQWSTISMAPPTTW